jgi:hypothetical protein
VADILSHDPSGAPCYDNRDGVYFSNGNQSENYPNDGINRLAICPHYTTELDGGHLGSVSTGKIRVAKAFWVLMAQIAGWRPYPVATPTMAPQPTSTPIPTQTPTGLPPTPTFTPTWTPTTGPTSVPTATPLPTGTPSGDSPMMVGDIDSVTAATGGGTWRAQVVLRVHNSSDLPVVNAIVSLHWDPSIGAPSSCTTNGAGVCAVATDRINRDAVPSFRFTIANISHPAYPYVSSLNHDVEGDSDGTSITVSAP